MKKGSFKLSQKDRRIPGPAYRARAVGERVDAPVSKTGSSCPGVRVRIPYGPQTKSEPGGFAFRISQRVICYNNTMRERNIKFDNAKIGVYRIIAPSGKMYIGMTCNSFENRWNGHRKDFRRQKSKCRGLLRAANKYGIENLSFEICEAWIKPDNKEEFDELEKLILQKENYWWNYYKDQGVQIYNGEPTGTGSVRHTEESRENLRKTLLEKSKKEIPFSNFEKAEMERLYREGVENREILRILNIAPIRFENQNFSFQEIHLKISQEERKFLKEKAINLRGQGFTTAQIAKKLNVSIPTVLKYSPNEKLERDFKTIKCPYCFKLITQNVIAYHIKMSHSGSPSWQDYTKVDIPLSLEDISKIESLYRMGHPLDEISEILKIYPFRLRKFFSEKDFQNVLDQEQKTIFAETARRLLKEGKPLYQIAEYLGLSRQLLRKILDTFPEKF